MIDESAIKRIEALTAAGAGLKLDNLSDLFQVPAVVLPAGCQVHDLEKLLPRPVRRRSTFSSQRLRSFLEYLAEFASPGETVVFANEEGDAAQAIIDYGSNANPGWGSHRAHLEMFKTPEFEAVEALCERPRTQREFVEWLEDWSHLVRLATASEEWLSVTDAIKSVRAVKMSALAEIVSKEADFETTKSALEQISAKSENGELPATIRAELQVYHDTSALDIKVRVSIVTTQKEPAFRFRIVGLEAIKDEVTLEIASLIQKGAPSGVPVYVGRSR